MIRGEGGASFVSGRIHAARRGVSGEDARRGPPNPPFGGGGAPDCNTAQLQTAAATAAWRGTVYIGCACCATAFWGEVDGLRRSDYTKIRMIVYRSGPVSAVVAW